MVSNELDQKTQEAFFTLENLIKDIKESVKPNDRSEQDRRFAIVITELEKVKAYYHCYIINQF